MLQEIKQTVVEKFEMYMKCKKKKLVEMLIACNDTLELITNKGVFLQENAIPNPISYGVDAEAKMMEEFDKEMNKSKEEHYSDIKEILNIKCFMAATNDNLDMLFKYMFSATKGIRLSNAEVAEFIKDEYGDDFFYRREMLKNEEYERENKH